MASNRWSLRLLLVLLITQASESASQNLFQKMARFAGGKARESSLPEDIPTTTLSNGLKMPLVGLGVGNMVAEVIPALVSQAIQGDKETRLFDTSHVSRNELLVARGITEGVERLRKTSGLADDEKVEIHVVTKVWYTHLGYDRTIKSVQSSLENLSEAANHKNIDLKVHVVLQWPRCYDSIPWMKCMEEENNLPEDVKAAGPPPHLDKANAWKGSWKALEDMYKQKKIASIGIANFHLKELEILTGLARVQPHMIQSNVWSLLYDPLLVEYCHRRNIHLQAFHLMNGVIMKSEDAPFAYHHLLVVANELSKDMRDNNILGKEEAITPAQVLMAWLVQHQVSVIPRTTNLGHLGENSAASLAMIPAMTDEQVKTVAHSVEALLSGEDVKEDAYVKVTFYAKSKDIYLYWADQEYGGEIQVSYIEKGDQFEESSHPGHTFRVYDSEDKKSFDLFTVEGNYGDHHHIEL